MNAIFDLLDCLGVVISFGARRRFLEKRKSVLLNLDDDDDDDYDNDDDDDDDDKQ